VPRRQAEGSVVWFRWAWRLDWADCDLESNDDVFCLKRSAQNVRLTRTVLQGDQAAPFKIGTETDGAFRNIHMTDCTIRDSDRGAITIESVDGALIDGVFISRIRMNNVAAPLFIRLGDRLRYGGKLGAIRNIVIQDVDATGGSKDIGIGSSILGLPGHPVENVTLRNVRWVYKGGGTGEDARRQVPEFSAMYPEYDLQGRMPAYALFARYVHGLTLEDFRVSFAAPDRRPAVILQGVERASLKGFEAQTAPGGPPPLATLPAPPTPAKPREEPSSGAPVWIDVNRNGRIDASELAFRSIKEAVAVAKPGDSIQIGRAHV